MAVWLQYGLTKTGALVNVDEVVSGRTALHCPYCSGTLTAKKGRKVTHHFAHAEQTCAAVAGRSGDELPLLPLYTDFAADLGKRELETLHRLWSGGNNPNRRSFNRLINGGYIRFNQFIGRSGDHEFTKLGKIPVGGLSVPLFADIQQERLLERLSEFERSVWHKLNPDPTLCHLSFIEAIGDYRLYRAQLQRVLSQHLYYLKIETADAGFYKIGVTGRQIEARIAEIKGELRGHVGAVEIKLLGLWHHCGRIEHYFKHRFRGNNQPIGGLTEYFRFEDEQAKKVLRELRRLKSKQALSEAEQAVLIQESSPVEKKVEMLKLAYWEEVERMECRRRRSQAVRTGMSRAAIWGQHVGRPKGKESIEDFLAKPKNQAIAAALAEKRSLREIARQTGASVNTIRKVKKFLADSD